MPVNVTVSVPLPVDAGEARERGERQDAVLDCERHRLVDAGVVRQRDGIAVRGVEDEGRVLVGHLRVVHVAERDGAGAAAGADRRGGGKAARAVADAAR